MKYEYAVLDRYVSLKLVDMGYKFLSAGDNLKTPNKKVWYFKYEDGIKQAIFDICQERRIKTEKEKLKKRNFILVFSISLAEKLVKMGYPIIDTVPNKNDVTRDVFVFKSNEVIADEVVEYSISQSKKEK